MSIKLFSIISLAFFLSVNDVNANDTNNYLSLTQLNKAMQYKLKLTQEQSSKIFELNRDYWAKKNSILQSPNMIGQNTALLACWDNWMQNLSQQLTKEQMNIFLEWQSKVNFLSEQII